MQVIQFKIKLDYVYAQAIGKTKGRDAYISELEEYEGDIPRQLNW
jgi:hypothetical protein